MNTNTTSPENNPHGSSGIPEQGSEGNSGPVDMRTNPSRPHQGTDNANRKPSAAVKNPVQKPAKKVFRKTELHGTGPAATPEERDRVRRRTIQNLKEPGAEVTYKQFEAAFKDFTCSLIMRQDRIRDELFLHVADLQQQVSDLETRLHRSTKTMQKRGRPAHEDRGIPARQLGVGDLLG